MNTPEAAAANTSVKRGLGWSATAQFICLAIRLGSTVIVARFLPPQAYGLLGAAMAAVTLMEWLTDFGLVPGLTRSRHGDQADWLDTAWTLNTTRGWALAGVGLALAWPWSLLVGQPALAPVLAALALRPLVLGLRSPASLVYRRRMNFRAIALEEIAQTACGTSVTLIMAMLYGSVWALVAGTLAGALAVVGTSYWLAPSWPRLLWHPAAVAELRRFGSGVMLNTMAMALSQNLDRLAGPRVVSLEELGLYAVAANLAAVAEGLQVRCCDVHFAALARIPGPAQQHQAHARLRQKLAGPFLAASVAGAFASPWLIDRLYDNRYQAAGPILGLLVVRLAIRAVSLFEFQRLLASGTLRPATLAYLVAMPVQVVGLMVVATGRWPGGMGMAWCGIAVALAHLGTQAGMAELANRQAGAFATHPAKTWIAKYRVRFNAPAKGIKPTPLN